MINVYMNTWGNYNENGGFGGKWISLPMHADELTDVLEALAKEMGDHDAEWFINDYEFEDNDIYWNIDENENVFELNELAEELDGLDSHDKKKLSAMLEAETSDVHVALRDMDDHIFYEGMTMLDLAHEFMEDYFGMYKIPDFIERHFDYDSYVDELEYDYTETAYGVLSK